MSSWEKADPRDLEDGSFGVGRAGKAAYKL